MCVFLKHSIELVMFEFEDFLLFMVDIFRDSQRAARASPGRRHFLFSKGQMGQVQKNWANRFCPVVVM